MPLSETLEACRSPAGRIAAGSAAAAAVVAAAAVFAAAEPEVD